MPNTLESPHTEYEVQISHQPHAFLVSNITIHDLGLGRQVELGLNGVKYKAGVSAEALRTAPNLTGIWRATMYIRSKSDASLERVTQIRRLRSASAGTLSAGVAGDSSTNDQLQAPFWTCTGFVKAIDAEQSILEIEVQTAKHAPFSLFARCTDMQARNAAQFEYAHLTGTLEAGYLVVRTLEARAAMGDLTGAENLPVSRDQADMKRGNVDG